MSYYNNHEVAVRDRFVVPFYGKVLNANLIRQLNATEQEAWLATFTATANELDEPTAALLLSTPDWRWQLVGSWMVGFKSWDSFATQMEAQYGSANQYAQQGYCVAFALLGTSSSSDALSTYLDAAFLQESITGSRVWALAALVELDRQNGTHRAERFLLKDGPWERWQQRHTNRPLAPISEIVELLNGYR